MVRAFAGDSTITSLVPCPFLVAPFPVPVTLSEAAPLPAALLLAGTLFPTSHPRHGPSHPSHPRLAAVRPASGATLAARTIRGAATKCPSLPRNPLSLQPLKPPRLFPATVPSCRPLLSRMACAACLLAQNKRQWPSTTTLSCTCHAERPAMPRGVSSLTMPSMATGSWPGSGCSPTAAGRLPSAAGSYAPYGHSEVPGALLIVVGRPLRLRRLARRPSGTSLTGGSAGTTSPGVSGFGGVSAFAFVSVGDVFPVGLLSGGDMQVQAGAGVGVFWHLAGRGGGRRHRRWLRVAAWHGYPAHAAAANVLG